MDWLGENQVGEHERSRGAGGAAGGGATGLFLNGNNFALSVGSEALLLETLTSRRVRELMLELLECWLLIVTDEVSESRILTIKGRNKGCSGITGDQ